MRTANTNLPRGRRLVGYDVPMRRRIGYIIGLLVVLACVAAYPLTWGRAADVRYTGERWLAGTRVRSGQCRISVVRLSKPFVHKGYMAGVNDWPAEADVLYSIKGERTSYEGVGGWVHFPLWLPALPVSLFMVWRWGRRTREGAVFPVTQR